MSSQKKVTTTVVTQKNKKKKKGRKKRTSQTITGYASSRAAVGQMNNPGVRNSQKIGIAGTLSYSSVSNADLSIPGNKLDISEFISPEGTKVIRLSGTYIVAAMTYTTISGITKPAYVYALAARGSGIILSPYGIFTSTSRQIKIVNEYSRFMFRKARLAYVPTCATSESNSFLSSFFSDGYAASYLAPTGSFPFTYAQMLDIEPSTLQSVYRPFVLNADKYLDQKSWYYLDLAADEVADYRQAYQGGFQLGYETATGLTDNRTYGYLVLDYVLDLCDPMPYVNLAADGDDDSKSGPLVRLRRNIRSRGQQLRLPRKVSLASSSDAERTGEPPREEEVVRPEADLRQPLSAGSQPVRLGPRSESGLFPRTRATSLDISRRA